MKYKVLDLLKAEEDCLSGEKMSEIFGVSRTYIWKLINSLKDDGYLIESVARKGYKLVKSPDILTFSEIKDELTTEFIGHKLEYFETIDSTNKYAKEHIKDLADGAVIVAEEQSQGRGRLGRHWKSSKNKGIYFSIVLKPKLSPSRVSRITLIGASAVYLGLEEMGIKSLIKWPNDIILNGKKICGILTEMTCELGLVDYIVIGIGVNVNQDLDDFGEELKNKAGSIKLVSGEKLDRKLLLAKILNNFERLYQMYIEEDNFEETLKIARENSLIIGQEVSLLSFDSKEKVRVVDITEEGHLLVKTQGGQEKEVYSGEVSLRDIEGYI